MKWLVLLVSLGFACGTSTDDRPRTTAYVTKTVLAQTCAEAQCHSSFVQKHGYAFDTVDAVKHTLFAEITAPVRSALISESTAPPDQPLSNVLRLRNGDPNPDGIKAMPYDSPMPEADVELLLEWAALGEPGACELAPGATVCGFAGAARVHCGDDHEYVFETVPTGGSCE